MAQAAIARAGGDPDLAARADEYEADILENEARYDEALPLQKRVLQQREKRFGPEDYRVAASWINLGECYRLMSRFDEAISSFERGRAIAEKTVGPQHPNVALAWNNIGAALSDGKGLKDEAQLAFEKALAIREAALGPEHLDTAKSLSNLALTFPRDRHVAAVALRDRGGATRSGRGASDDGAGAVHRGAAGHAAAGGRAGPVRAGAAPVGERRASPRPRDGAGDAAERREE
jgi:tetratricopeptide (TPR) repeat protein